MIGPLELSQEVRDGVGARLSLSSGPAPREQGLEDDPLGVGQVTGVGLGVSSPFYV